MPVTDATQIVTVEAQVAKVILSDKLISLPHFIYHGYLNYAFHRPEGGIEWVRIIDYRSLRQQVNFALQDAWFDFREEHKQDKIHLAEKRMIGDANNRLRFLEIADQKNLLEKIYHPAQLTASYSFDETAVVKNHIFKLSDAAEEEAGAKKILHIKPCGIYLYGGSKKTALYTVPRIMP